VHLAYVQHVSLVRGVHVAPLLTWIKGTVGAPANLHSEGAHDWDCDIPR